LNFANMTAVDLRVSGGSAALAGTVRANIEVRLGSPTGTLAATLPVLNAPNGNYNTQRVALPASLTGAGAQQVYLVFRATGAAGQPTGNLFNLNWMSFVGQGVTTP
ncbi:carbohydrate-binding protein, partial [Motilibacter deserti]